jgi:DNA-binding CsgD family transcriptional regulator
MAPSRRRGHLRVERGSSPWDGLTASELQVAHLAAEGLTNRQIGARLFVSRRTVETHLAHVYQKLGFSGRAQVAAEVARRQVAAAGQAGNRSSDRPRR